jgi:PAS domain S-box-containing protein
MGKETILIVEDEAIVAEDLANKLSQLGYEISGTTASGEAAVALARNLRPNLVLMDIHLAGPMDGVEAAERIRQECALPVIYLTAHSDRATLERAKLTQPFGYILKPFEELDLETHIQMALYKHQAELKLRESEERFRTAFEHGIVPMALNSLDHRLLRVNAAFCQMLGYPEAELLRRNFLEITHPDDVAANRAGLEQVTAGALPSFRMEKRYIQKNGRVIWGDMSTALVRDAQNQPLYLVTHVQDITQRKRAEEALARANEELQTANEELQTTNEDLQAANEELRTTGEQLIARNEQLASLTEALRVNNEQLEQRVVERTAQLRALAAELTKSEERERQRIAEFRPLVRCCAPELLLLAQ